MSLLCLKIRVAEKRYLKLMLISRGVKFYLSTGTLIQASLETDFSEKQRRLPAQGWKHQVPSSLSSWDLQESTQTKIKANKQISQ